MGAKIAHPEGLGAHGAPRLGPSPPRSRQGPHHPRPGAPRRERRGDADGRGRPGRPLLLQPPREGGLLRRLGARSPCYCCLDPIPPLRGGSENSKPQPCDVLDCQGPVLVHARGPSTNGGARPLRSRQPPRGCAGQARPPLETCAARTRNARDQRFRFSI